MSDERLPAAGALVHTSPSPRRRLSPETPLDVALLRDPGDTLAPEADLFRSAAFFRLHAPSFTRAWYGVALDASSGDVVAAAWFAELERGQVKSGARGPYGGFHTPYAALPIAVVDRLVAATEEELRARQITGLTVTLPPAAHDPEGHAEWMNVLLRRGYDVAPPDLNYHVAVGEGVLADRMNSGNRAIVRTAGRKGMIARELLAEEREDAYWVNAQNRLRRGRRMTMTFDALAAMDASIPGALHWFGVFSGERMIAASVTMRISPQTLYVFYLGEVDGVERASPVTLLVAFIHDWCRDQGITLLDLGIATESGVPNEGLMAYKRNLGFGVSPKYTLTRTLVP